ncbi:signal peptidase I [Halosquirtibacter laminarini]|uniref:Signal peptidase I n=1 Tax=Halosquirtibacter laminarini TaxID=3374600 RepID=A0AC61NPY7_9BACT|nr:signal peptidase I [Prolixibacteraceae bacterium]
MKIDRLKKYCTVGLYTVIFMVVIGRLVNLIGISSYIVPSASMLPTILPGERIYVDKLGYGETVRFLGMSIRMPKFRGIQRGSVIAFHFPEGDTVFVDTPFDNFYDMKRRSIVNKRDILLKTSMFLPLSFRPLYVKRCIGLPGDSLSIKKGDIYLNSMIYDAHFNTKRWYHIYVKDLLKVKKWLSFISNNQFKRWHGHHVVLLTESERTGIETLIDCGVLDRISPYIETFVNHSTYPFLGDHPISWTWDNYGPVYIPKKGDTLQIKGDHIYRYKRMIEVYEKNSVHIHNDSLFVNGRYCEKYICKQDYYFMMGDNRHNSLDSRNWGLVPEDHIVGRVFAVKSSKGNVIPRLIDSRMDSIDSCIKTRRK